VYPVIEVASRFVLKLSTEHANKMSVFALYRREYIITPELVLGEYPNMECALVAHRMAVEISMIDKNQGTRHPECNFHIEMALYDAMASFSR
jgi:hypothetical protein